MKKVVLPMIALACVAGASSAVLANATQNQNPGPEVINLKMGVVLLPFQHHAHQKSLNNSCRDCHSKKIGKIEGWGEETAHRICIPCHDLDEKGPVLCHQCHGDKK